MPFDGTHQASIDHLTMERFAVWLNHSPWIVGEKMDENDCPIVRWLIYETGEYVVKSYREHLSIGDQCYKYAHWMVLFMTTIDRRRWPRLVTRWHARRILRRIEAMIAAQAPANLRSTLEEIRT